MRARQTAAANRIGALNDVALYIGIFAIGYIGGLLTAVAFK